MTNTTAALAQIQRICRYVLVFSLFWHALMPKLIFRDATELALVMAHGIDQHTALWLSASAGIGEFFLAIWLMIRRYHTRALWLYAGLLILLLLDTLIVSPQFAVSAFNVVSLNVALLCLIWIDQCLLTILSSSGELPAHPPTIQLQGWQALRAKSRMQMNTLLYRVVEKLSLRQIHLLAKTLMKDDWQRRRRNNVQNANNTPPSKPDNPENL